MRGKIAPVLAALAVIVPSAAHAETANSSINVSANVQAACTVTSNQLAFGNIGTAQADASTSILVNCTNGTGYSIALNNGSTAGATTAARLLSGTNNGVARTIPYTIYRDANRTQLWGSDTPNLVSGIGSGVPVAVGVFGRVTPGSAGVLGVNYTDTVSVTLTY